MILTINSTSRVWNITVITRLLGIWLKYTHSPSGAARPRESCLYFSHIPRTRVENLAMKYPWIFHELENDPMKLYHGYFMAKWNCHENDVAKFSWSMKLHTPWIVHEMYFSWCSCKSWVYHGAISWIFHWAQLVHRGVSIINYLTLHGSLKMCSVHLELTAADFLHKLLVIYTCML